MTSITDFAYYALIYNWIGGKIDQFSTDVMGRSMEVLSATMLMMVTLWVMMHGYRIVTGQSRDSAMVTVHHLIRMALIVFMAGAVSVSSPRLVQFLSEDVSTWINEIVTGQDQDASAMASSIDTNLAYTQVAMAAIDAVQVPTSDTVSAQSTARAEFMATLGTAGPAVVAGAMLLMYRIALALLLGLGPLFILCLIFPQTHELFRRWLMYLLGTLFSMALLYWVVSVGMQLTANVAKALWATSIINTVLLGDTGENLNSQALQQGGVGLMMTVLIISTPPMAAMLFNGTLGNFSPFATVGGGGAAGRLGPQGQLPGSYASGGPGRGMGPMGQDPQGGQNHTQTQNATGGYYNNPATVVRTQAGTSATNPDTTKYKPDNEGPTR